MAGGRAGCPKTVLSTIRISSWAKLKAAQMDAMARMIAIVTVLMVIVMPQNPVSEK